MPSNQFCKLFSRVTQLLNTKASNKSEAAELAEKERLKIDKVGGSIAKFLHASLFVTAAVARSKAKPIKKTSRVADSTFEVHFSPGPLGMKLEPITIVPEKGKVKELGCHVLDFSATEKNQARDSGQIKPGDVIVEIDGQNVDGCEYSESIALLKKPRMSLDGEPIGRSLKFRRPLVDDEESDEDEEKTYTVEFNSSKPLGMILEPITETMGCHVLNFSANKSGQARDSGQIQPGDVIIEVDGEPVDGSEYSDTIALLKTPLPSSGGVPTCRRIKFRRPLAQIEESDEDTEAEDTYTVELNFSKPLGMILDPVTVAGESKGTRKECGCFVADFSKSGKNQAFDLGQISIGDIIIAIDGVDVSSGDYPYASIIALLKKKAGGIKRNKKRATITFRRATS